MILAVLNYDPSPSVNNIEHFRTKIDAVCEHVLLRYWKFDIRTVQYAGVDIKRVSSTSISCRLCKGCPASELFGIDGRSRNGASTLVSV
jgi:hypothetical protein